MPEAMVYKDSVSTYISAQFQLNTLIPLLHCSPPSVLQLHKDMAIVGGVQWQTILIVSFQGNGSSSLLCSELVTCCYGNQTWLHQLVRHLHR